MYQTLTLALVLSLFTHAHPYAFCNCKYMRWVLVATFAAVSVDYGIRVQWQGVNGN